VSSGTCPAYPGRDGPVRQVLGLLATQIGLSWSYVVVAVLLAAAVPSASAAARVAVHS
jgi:hypothetical protein